MTTNIKIGFDAIDKYLKYEPKRQIIDANDLKKMLIANTHKDVVGVKNLIINGDLDLSEIVFESPRFAEFEGCIFKGKVNFGDARFKDLFCNATVFRKEVNFENADFKKKVFKNATFENNIHFGDATVEGKRMDEIYTAHKTIKQL